MILDVKLSTHFCSHSHQRWDVSLDTLNLVLPTWLALTKRIQHTWLTHVWARTQKTFSFCSLPVGLLPSLEISLKWMERSLGGKPGQQLANHQIWRWGHPRPFSSSNTYQLVECLSKPNLDNKNLAELHPNYCLTELRTATTTKWLFIWTISIFW